MKSLFIKSLSKLKREHKLTQLIVTNLQAFESSTITQFRRNPKAKSLVRLPISQVRIMLKSPCPVSAISDKQIQIFKRLRRSFSVKQPSACSKCPKALKCPFSGQQPEQKLQARLHHLIFYLFNLEKMPYQSYSVLRWSAAYKVCQSLRILLRDLQGIQKQAQLYNQIIRQQDHQSKQEANESVKQKDIYKNRRFHLNPDQNRQ